MKICLVFIKLIVKILLSYYNQTPNQTLEHEKMCPWNPWIQSSNTAPFSEVHSEDIEYFLAKPS